MLAEQYRPEKKENEINKHVFSAGLKFLVVTLVCDALAVLCLWWYPQLNEGSLLAWVVERFVRCVLVLNVAEGYFLYKDWYLNGNLFKGIIQTPLSCSLFGGLVFIGIVLVCIGG